MPERVICNRIVDKTCKETAKCCMHRTLHIPGDTCSTENCRFAPEGIARCVPEGTEPTSVPVQQPQQREVVIVSPEPQKEAPEPIEETQILEPEEPAKQEEAAEPAEKVEEKKIVGESFKTKRGRKA